MRKIEKREKKSTLKKKAAAKCVHENRFFDNEFHQTEQSGFE